MFTCIPLLRKRGLIILQYERNLYSIKKNMIFKKEKSKIRSQVGFIAIILSDLVVDIFKYNK